MAEPAGCRLDLFLKAAGRFPSRQAARAAIREGRVLVDGERETRPGVRVKPGSRVEVAPGPATYVSRGGRKLEVALETFRIAVGGRVCLDVGAATGGFTDCLLRHGAVRVYAVDVGRGQMAARLRADPRVCVREETDVRNLDPASLDPRPDLATVDVSFISLGLVLPAVTALLAADAAVDVVALVKPQFEAGRGGVKRGVVRSAAVHRRVLEETVILASGLGLTARGLVPSPLREPRANAEFLLHLSRRGEPAVDGLTVGRVVAQAHGEGGDGR